MHVPFFAMSVSARSGIALCCFLLAPMAYAAAPLDRVVASLEAVDLGGVDHPFFLLGREWSVALDVLRGRANDSSTRRLLDGELGLRLLEARADRMEVEAARSDPEAARHLRDHRRALVDGLRAGLVVRAGGATAIDRLRVLHSTFDRAFSSLVQRRAAAAIAAESLGLVALSVDEGEARELFRQGGHPFEAARFDDAREAFTQWLLVDRLERAGQRHLDQVRRLVHVNVPTLFAETL